MSFEKNTFSWRVRVSLGREDFQEFHWVFKSFIRRMIHMGGHLCFFDIHIHRSQSTPIGSLQQLREKA